MGKLAEWCVGQPEWAVDAMQRVACSPGEIEANVDALVSRIAIAHGLDVDGDHPCQAFDESSVVTLESSPDNVVLQSLGPLQGLDRLASSQELKFALNGITVIFGDNGSGKSGYTRALRQLTCVREDAPLQGNVFKTGVEEPKAITFTYQLGASPAVTETWKEGDPKPNVLGAVTLLDSDNLRVYVSGKNDILYMPPEAACVGRLAEVYQLAASRYRRWIDDATARCGGVFGGQYPIGSSAAQLISRVQITSSRAQLPSEQELRAAAQWSEEHEAELTGLISQLARGPEANAALSDRIAAACASVASTLEPCVEALTDQKVQFDGPAVSEMLRAKGVADALVAEQIGAQPISATGSDAWRELFRIARQFAAEAGLKPTSDPFEVGEPCPLCQQPLSSEATVRLAAFDAFVEGRATQEAQAAASRVAERLSQLQALAFKSEEDLRVLFGEAAAQGNDAQALVDRTIAYSTALKLRRDERVRQLVAGQIGELATLPACPMDDLRAWAAQLSEYAATVRSGDDQTTAMNLRISELTGQKQLSGQLDDVLKRRAELHGILAWKDCEAALNTGPLSRLMTSLRKELTTPELSRRIGEEIRGLALSHIPLQFSDETAKGTSYFEVELATERKVKKSRVLSEGEQRALSLACFLGEAHVAGKKAGIIFDDPVTSLDHARVRLVAKRLVEEAAKGRQIIVFTHNLVFYHEVMLACVDRDQPVPALPCLIQQGGSGEFGLITVGDEPWVARKVKEREQTLKSLIDAIPDDLVVSSDDYKRKCTGFYAALRETWERAVEEIVLNDVVRRFGSNVGTLRLGGVDVSDDDFMIVCRAMSRASEHSGHDQAAGRQIDVPSKAQMQDDLSELTAFRAAKTKSNRETDTRRKALASAPPRATTA